MFKKVKILVFLMLVWPCLAWGMEFQPIGFEPLSMGGAGVASARGSFATYYNPALLGIHRYGTQISISAGVGIREVNLVDHIDKLADVGIESTIDEAIQYIEDNGLAVIGTGLSPELQDKFKTITSELRAIGTKNGLQLMPTASAGVQIGNFGFGVFGLSEGTAHAVIDPDHLDIIVKAEVTVNGTTQPIYVKYDEEQNQLSLSDLQQYQASSLEYAIDNGLTYLKLTGLAYFEIPVAYAHHIKTQLGDVYLGGAIKLMPGVTFDGQIKVDTESGDISSELKDADKRDTSWGVDLGILYQPRFVKGLSIGLVGKNLNTPEFDTATGDTYKVDPQFRLGLAYDFSAFTFALDADLTQNDTFIPDYKAQYVGGGVNFHPFSWLNVRAGAMQNIAESDEGLILTGGLAFGLKWFQLDLAAQVSTKSGEFSGTSVPRYTRIQLSLVS
ncbi:conjugal transfer protein TraF, partial [Thermodesulfatator indicus]